DNFYTITVLYTLSLYLYSDSYFHRSYINSFPTRRSSDLLHKVRALHDRRAGYARGEERRASVRVHAARHARHRGGDADGRATLRSEEHTSELQSLRHLVCRLLLEKKKKKHDKRNAYNNNI